MDTKDILKATQTTQQLIQDSDYYKHIFKKTERIVSVVFYITHNLPDISSNKGHIETIEAAARSVHEQILQTLSVRAHVAEDVVRSAAHSVIALESKLLVAQTSGLIAPEVLSVLSNEIDAVLRGMNKYLQSEVMAVHTSDTERVAPRSTKQPTTIKSGEQANTAVASSLKDNRQSRIQTVIEARGEATIKDIAEVITDVSEKTIQRELNSLIEDNVVKRIGERRWSRYTMFN